MVEISRNSKVIDFISAKNVTNFINHIPQLEKELNEILAEEYEYYDEVFDSLLAAYHYFNYIGESNCLNGLDGSITLLYNKTQSDLFSIYQCCRSGCLYQAGVILRSLLETLFITKFIYQDYDDRVELYRGSIHLDLFDFLSVEEKESAQDSLKEDYIINRSWYAKLLEQIITSDDELKNKYKNKTSIKALAGVVGMEEEYITFYSFLSKLVHGSIGSGSLHLINEEMAFHLNFKPEILCMIITKTITYASDFVKTISYSLLETPIITESEKVMESLASYIQLLYDTHNQ